MQLFDFGDSPINTYKIVKECDYKEEHYSVRDNGAIMRHQRIGMRKRKLDGIWSFGEPNPYGYLDFGNERVHRIVCTAFHGNAPSDQYVVDHIDTNRQNNRPENLRWLTKLENILNNDITRKKIELICGSVEAFLKNPSLLRGHETDDKNFTWMRNVSVEEAQNCLDNWNNWVKTVKANTNYKKGDISNRIFKTAYKTKEQLKEEIEENNRRLREEELGLKDSLTKNAKQLKWKTPTEFLLCPSEHQNKSLQTYLNNLSKGKVFLKNEFTRTCKVYDFGYNATENAIYVLTYDKNNIKKWALCKITLQDDFFVHESEGTFFKEDGGLKYLTLALDKEWTGGDVFDDFC
ncbi:MAG: HNH endonuclease [Salinivirgaceae bacterium]|nr:HNH endonuclease [Salinivirgaceae bacterium]